jgi:O-antigen ligase
VRRTQVLLFAAAALAPVALFPLIRRPVFALVAVGFVAAVGLASRSPAYPLAFAGIPSALFALTGSDPLPKGAVAGIVFGWIVLGIVIWLARSQNPGVGTVLFPELGLSVVPVLLSGAFAVVMLARLGGSPAASYGTQKLELFASGALPAMLAAVIVARRREDFDLFIGLTLVVAVFTAAALFTQLIGGHETAYFTGRYTLSSQESPIDLGRQTGIGLLLALYLVISSPTVWVRLAALAALPVLAVGLIASGSRGPVVGVTLGLVVLLGLISADAASRRRLPAIVVGVVGAVVLVAQIVPGQATLRALSVLTGTGAGVSSNGRSELWSQALSTFQAHQVMGIGTGGFASLNPTEMYPHNLLLEVSAELGLLGLALLLGLLISGGVVLVATCRRAVSRDRVRAALVLSLFVAALVNAMFSGDVSTNSDVWLALGLGVGLAPEAVRAGRRMREGRPLGGEASALRGAVRT